MQDEIVIDGLELWTRIGVPEEERRVEQRVLATITLERDLHAAAAGDDVRKSIDYEAVVRDVRMLAKEERKTIEAFAEDIAQHILETYKPASVTVTLTKFPLPGIREIRVSITRP